MPHVEREQVQQLAGRIVQRGRDHYRYDRRGRLVEKTEHPNGFRPRHWHYRWNADNRLIELTTPDGERWRYAYDALGRRVRKLKLLPGGKLPELRAEQVADAGEALQAPPHDTPSPGRRKALSNKRALPTHQGEHYLWAGDQLIEAAPIYADGTVAWSQATRWAYAPGGITPLAQQKAGKLWFVVTDHLGTPRELLSEAGEVEWSNSPETWGRQRLWSRPAANDDAIDCPIRFPGQYFDEESGLHYNRHRYYDPASGQYLSPDPLKLDGGFRPQGYVHDPNGWVDPLGLAGCPKDASGRPIESQNYSIAYEAQMQHGLNYPERSDSHHFQVSNQQLHEAMLSDNVFASSMESMYPGITQGIQPGARGAYPRRSPHSNLTWHHEASRPGVMQLIPTAQHQSPGPVQAVLHPGQTGGMQNWGGGR